MTTYRNPWFTPGRPEYGPAEYSTEAKPTEYRGYLIFNRIPRHVWDVVKDGACVTQMAGPNGARTAIDAMEDGEWASTNAKDRALPVLHRDVDGRARPRDAAPSIRPKS